jgi:hypothetical protein
MLPRWDGGYGAIPAVAVDRTERLRWVVNDLDIACAQTQKSPWQACQGLWDKTFNEISQCS